MYKTSSGSYDRRQFTGGDKRETHLVSSDRSNLLLVLIMSYSIPEYCMDCKN